MSSYLGINEARASRPKVRFRCRGLSFRFWGWSGFTVQQLGSVECYIAHAAHSCLCEVWCSHCMKSTRTTKSRQHDVPKPRKRKQLFVSTCVWASLKPCRPPVCAGSCPKSRTQTQLPEKNRKLEPHTGVTRACPPPQAPKPRSPSKLLEGSRDLCHKFTQGHYVDTAV